MSPQNTPAPERLASQVILGPLAGSDASRAAFFSQLANSANHYEIIGCDLSQSADIDRRLFRRIDRLARRSGALVVLVDAPANSATDLRSLNCSSVVIGRAREIDEVRPVDGGQYPHVPPKTYSCSVTPRISKNDPGPLHAVVPLTARCVVGGAAAVREPGTITGTWRAAPLSDSAGSPDSQPR